MTHRYLLPGFNPRTTTRAVRTGEDARGGAGAAGVSILARPRGPCAPICGGPQTAKRHGFQSSHDHEGRAHRPAGTSATRKLPVSILARPRGPCAPLRGRSLSLAGASFNPRTTTRAVRTWAPDNTARARMCFNPRTTTRAVRTRRRRTAWRCCCSFQSTHHHEGRAHRLPPAAATAQLSPFQSSHDHEGRAHLGPLVIVAVRVQFQSSHDHEGRAHLARRFQTRLPFRVSILARPRGPCAPQGRARHRDSWARFNPRTTTRAVRTLRPLP